MKEVEQKIRQKSAYLKQVHDFARYIRKEYIDPNNGEMTLFISATDFTDTNDTNLSFSASLGNKDYAISGLASLVSQNPNAKRMFDITSAIAGDFEFDVYNLKEKKKQKRFIIFTSVLFVLWSIAVTLFWVFNIINWVTAISNSLLLVFLFFKIYTTYQENKQSTQAIQERLNERSNIAMAHKMIKMQRAMRNSQSEDEDED